MVYSPNYPLIKAELHPFILLARCFSICKFSTSLEKNSYSTTFLRDNFKNTSLMLRVCLGSFLIPPALLPVSFLYTMGELDLGEGPFAQKSIFILSLKVSFSYFLSMHQIIIKIYNY